MVYVACSNSGVLIGTKDSEKAKHVVESTYLSDLTDADGNEVSLDYWIEVYDEKNIVGIIDFNKETLEFSSEFLKM